ncbi:MAG: hypothetical protein NZ527_02615 [Hydrogenobacter thermophilus]|uniref:c-type cytochrome biogenesis protein CcmI/CycH n=1 Tax=Hydrogenobacter thermophilus TaxID=940 RepID=UPI001C74C719|nr:hypothetical protein [Hydrogenobacter thermophilus]MCS7284587.1 hypothetical protein [Hydrogenobacter thermophilus]QWK19669.1 MAG: hypothetical protein KNN13_09330 [Hydrogenobacter thermophilus]
MKRLLIFFALFIFSCQPVPKNVPIEKYRNQFIKGVVDVSAELKSKIPNGDHFLIISVRDLENPMPVAVLRVKNPKFPYNFKITGKNKIDNSRIMEGDVILTARVSRSPMAEAQKGDLLGSLQTKVGTQNNNILINAEVK